MFSYTDLYLKNISISIDMLYLDALFIFILLFRLILKVVFNMNIYACNFKGIERFITKNLLSEDECQVY